MNSIILIGWNYVEKLVPPKLKCDSIKIGGTAMYRVKLTCEGTEPAVILFNDNTGTKDLLKVLSEYLPNCNSTMWVIETDGEILGCVQSNKIVVHKSNMLKPTSLLRVQAIKYESKIAGIISRILTTSNKNPV